jgi:hypothetical protein
MYIRKIETVDEISVSSGSWGEDSYHELAGAAHFHVASPALNSKAVSRRRLAAFSF